MARSHMPGSMDRFRSSDLIKVVGVADGVAMLRVGMQISPDGALLLEGQVDLRVVLQAASVDHRNVVWIFSELFDEAVGILTQRNHFDRSDGLEIGVGKEIEADWIVAGPLGRVRHGAGAGADEEEWVRHIGMIWLGRQRETYGR